MRNRTRLTDLATALLTDEQVAWLRAHRARFREVIAREQDNHHRVHGGRRA